MEFSGAQQAHRGEGPRHDVLFAGAELLSAWHQPRGCCRYSATRTRPVGLVVRFDPSILALFATHLSRNGPFFFDVRSRVIRCEMRRQYDPSLLAQFVASGSNEKEKAGKRVIWKKCFLNLISPRACCVTQQSRCCSKVSTWTCPPCPCPKRRWLQLRRKKRDDRPESKWPTMSTSTATTRKKLWKNGWTTCSIVCTKRAAPPANLHPAADRHRQPIRAWLLRMPGRDVEPQLSLSQMFHRVAKKVKTPIIRIARRELLTAATVRCVTYPFFVVRWQFVRFEKWPTWQGSGSFPFSLW